MANSKVAQMLGPEAVSPAHGGPEPATPDEVRHGCRHIFVLTETRPPPSSFSSSALLPPKIPSSLHVQLTEHFAPPRFLPHTSEKEKAKPAPDAPRHTVTRLDERSLAKQALERTTTQATTCPPHRDSLPPHIFCVRFIHVDLNQAYPEPL